MAQRARAEVWELFSREDVSSVDDARRLLASTVATPMPDAAREVALEHFDQLLPNPEWFHMRAVAAATEPDLDPRHYAAALTWASAAHQLAPDRYSFLLTVSVLQYRLGKYREAMSSLETVQELTAGRDAAVWLAQALVQARLGEVSDARASYAKARELIDPKPDQERWIAAPAITPALLGECAQGIAGSPQ
ncbi:MAG: hypothetical protein D6744_09915 [Planctomycetota bacterium]|nr:MAG: hypothetical protein D6744_09915 [Planctomycetota bacterium]